MDSLCFSTVCNPQIYVGGWGGPGCNWVASPALALCLRECAHSVTLSLTVVVEGGGV